jgi:DNA-binding NarL/FixJ family response regulator
MPEIGHDGSRHHSGDARGHGAVTAVRVVLIEDHDLVRAGFRAILDALPAFEVVGEASNGHDGLRLIAATKPDLALVDLTMPLLNGLDMTARATKDHPRTRIIVLSMHSDEEYVRHALAAGASAYVLKTASKAELEIALIAVARGQKWLSPGVSAPVLDNYARRGDAARGPFEILTARQREVLQLLAEGESTKGIAQRLSLSVKTVETHRKQIMDRLDVHSVQGLVRYAMRAGLVT